MPAYLYRQSDLFLFTYRLPNFRNNNNSSNTIICGKCCICGDYCNIVAQTSMPSAICKTYAACLSLRSLTHALSHCVRVRACSALCISLWWVVAAVAAAALFSSFRSFISVSHCAVNDRSQQQRQSDIEGDRNRDCDVDCDSFLAIFCVENILVFT